MICLTFDVEERFHSHLVPRGAPRVWKLRDRIAQLIDVLQEREKTATFFVLGELAAKYPDLVRRMVASGFEVASHSYRHLRLDRNPRETCEEDISRAKNLLEDITGEPVQGYRAPSWSARFSDEWLWDCLESNGMRYDASLFPFRTNLYGSFSNPVSPFRLRPGLWEIPPSVHRLGPLRIPYGGGFYFRLLPLWLSRRLVDRDRGAGKAPILYFHPWDFEKDSMQLEKSCLNRFLGNHNIEENWSKFISVVDRYPIMRVRDYRDLLARTTHPSS